MLGLALYLSLLAAPAGATGADAPFDRDEIPLDDSDSRLLSEKGYTFDEQGLLHAAKGGGPLSKEDVAYLLEGLRSHRRLADLLEIKLIQDRVRTQGVMTAEDRKALRAIGERDWPILSKSSKADLRPLFSDRELAAMDARAPKAPLPDASVIDPPSVRPSQAPDQIPLTDPLKTFSGTLMPLGSAAVGPAAVPAVAPPAPAPVAAPVTPSPAPAPASPPPMAPPVASPAASETGVAPAAAELEAVPDDIQALPAPWAHEAPTAPAPVPAVEPPTAAPTAAALPSPISAPVPPPAPVTAPPSVQTPVPPPAPAPMALPDQSPPPLPDEAELENPASAAASPAAVPVVAPPLAAPNPIAISVPPSAGVVPVFRAEPAVAPKVKEAPSLRPSSVPAAPAPPPPPAVPSYPAFSQSAFNAFLAAAPYGKEEKALLSMLAADLPEPERSAAFGAAMSKMPHIVLDSRRAGAGRFSVGTMKAADGSLRGMIAVNDGPVMVTRDVLFGADEARFLPDEPSLFTAWSLPVPAQQAFSRENGAAGETVTKWGRARVYSDGSKRLVVSEAERAGALAHALLEYDSAMRMPADPYGADLRAWAGEFRFYLALEKSTRREPELSAGLSALYREWRERPLDFIDTVMHSRMIGSSADARILDEAGFPGAAILPAGPKALPAAGSEAEKAWLDSERAVRSGKEDD